MNLPQIISSPTFYWLPPLLLAFFLILGIGFGFMNGWKSALYFFGFEMIALLIGILAYDNLWDDIVVPILQKKAKAAGATIPIDDLLGLAKQPVMLIYLSVLLVVVWILSLIPYIFARKYFKETIKLNRKKKISNLKSRIGGATIGLVTSMPYAAFMATTSTVIAPDSKTINGLNTFSSVFTLGQAIDVSHSYDDSIALLKIVPISKKANKKLEEVIKAFEGLTKKPSTTPSKPGTTKPKDPVTLIKENKDTVKAIIQHPKLVKNIVNKINDDLKKKKQQPIDIKSKIKLIKTEADKDKAIEKLKQAGIAVDKNQLNNLINQFK